MIVREHVDRKERNLHPAVKQKWNEITQPPLPLKFKLHEMNKIKEAQGTMNLSQEEEKGQKEDETEATYVVF